MPNTYKVQFGFLPAADSVTFSGGKIIALPEFDINVADVAKLTHPDGHVYPPSSHDITKKPHWKKWRKISQTERAAHLHRLPPTHYLKINHACPDEQAARYGDAGFIMHFLGFIYGFRCQFYDWWMEGRINVRGDIDYIRPTSSYIGDCLERAFLMWSSWPSRQQIVAINILFLHTRTQVYENEWERFQAEYQILDAIFSLAKETKQIIVPRYIKHDKRPSVLCERYGIPAADDKFEKIRILRNDLLHEVLWDGGMPGEARSEISYRTSHWLHKLTKRIMLAVLGIDNDYIHSPWWFMGKFDFEGSERVRAQQTT